MTVLGISTILKLGKKNPILFLIVLKNFKNAHPKEF